jgi:DNA-binding HxlR family transcriptional regulator
MRKDDWTTERCPIARGLSVLGDRWSVLVLREVFLGRTRFSELRDRLGVASDVLTDRLGRLVEAGVLRREAYREEGSRERSRYVLTEAGEQGLVVLGALGAWAEEHRVGEIPSNTAFVDLATGDPVVPRFVTDDGRVVPAERVGIRETVSA